MTGGGERMPRPSSSESWPPAPGPDSEERVREPGPAAATEAREKAGSWQL